MLNFQMLFLTIFNLTHMVDANKAGRTTSLRTSVSALDPSQDCIFNLSSFVSTFNQALEAKPLNTFICLQTIKLFAVLQLNSILCSAVLEQIRIEFYNLQTQKTICLKPIKHE